MGTLFFMHYKQKLQVAITFNLLPFYWLFIYDKAVQVKIMSLTMLPCITECINESVKAIGQSVYLGTHFCLLGAVNSSVGNQTISNKQHHTQHNFFYCLQYLQTTI